MVKKIIWNKKGLLSFDSIITYLHDEASRQSAENFFNIVYKRIDVLVKHPYSGRKVGTKKLLES